MSPHLLKLLGIVFFALPILTYVAYLASPSALFNRWLKRYSGQTAHKGEDITEISVYWLGTKNFWLTESEKTKWYLEKLSDFLLSLQKKDSFHPYLWIVRIESKEEDGPVGYYFCVPERHSLLWTIYEMKYDQKKKVVVGKLQDHDRYLLDYKEPAADEQEAIVNLLLFMGQHHQDTRATYIARYLSNERIRIHEARKGGKHISNLEDEALRLTEEYIRDHGSCLFSETHMPNLMSVYEGNRLALRIRKTRRPLEGSVAAA